MFTRKHGVTPVANTNASGLFAASFGGQGPTQRVSYRAPPSDDARDNLAPNDPLFISARRVKKRSGEGSVSYVSGHVNPDKVSSDVRSQPFAGMSVNSFDAQDANGHDKEVAVMTMGITEATNCSGENIHNGDLLIMDTRSKEYSLFPKSKVFDPSQGHLYTHAAGKPISRRPPIIGPLGVVVGMCRTPRDIMGLIRSVAPLYVGQAKADVRADQRGLVQVG